MSKHIHYLKAYREDYPKSLPLPIQLTTRYTSQVKKSTHTTPQWFFSITALIRIPSLRLPLFLFLFLLPLPFRSFLSSLTLVPLSLLRCCLFIGGWCLRLFFGCLDSRSSLCLFLNRSCWSLDLLGWLSSAVS